MESQPQKGNLLAAEKIDTSTISTEERNLLLDQDNVEALMQKADELGVGPRRLRSQLEREAMATGYQPDGGALLEREVKNKDKSKKVKFGTKVFLGSLAVGGAINAIFGGGVAPVAAKEVPAPAPTSIELADTTVDYDGQILAQAEKTTSQETDANWDIEFLSESNDKRYEKNFGPVYEGEMNKESITADILDRAYKDPAFLAAMNASCGAIEHGGVDACTIDYMTNAEARQSSFDTVQDIMSHADTKVTHRVAEGYFDSTQMVPGGIDTVVDGTRIVAPSLAKSFDNKVPSGAPAEQKIVVKIENKTLGITMELRPDCGWQYYIVDRAEVADLPETTHELQEKHTSTGVPINSFKEFISAPKAESTPQTKTPDSTSPEEIVEKHTNTPENTPEATPENPKTPTNPETPTEPTEPVEPTEPTEPVEPTEPTEPVEPTEPTEPVEPTEPYLPIAPVPEFPTMPEKPKDTTPNDAKNWEADRKKPDGVRNDQKVNTNENNSLTKDPIKEGNGTKSPDMTGKGQDPRKEVTISVPKIEKPEKIDTKDTPIYNQLKEEYVKKNQEQTLVDKKAQVNETKKTQDQTKKYEADTKTQAETDKNEVKAKSEAQAEREAQVLAKQIADREAAAKEKAEAKPVKKFPGVKAETTELTDETNN